MGVDVLNSLKDAQADHVEHGIQNLQPISVSPRSDRSMTTLN